MVSSLICTLVFWFSKPVWSPEEIKRNNLRNNLDDEDTDDELINLDNEDTDDELINIDDNLISMDDHIVNMDDDIVNMEGVTLL